MTFLMTTFLCLLPFIANPFGLDQFRLPKEIFADSGIIVLVAVAMWEDLGIFW